MAPFCRTVTACDCDYGHWQDFEAKGGKVVVPVGCNGLEDWLLDNIEVPKLMPLLKKGITAVPRHNVHGHIEFLRPQDHQGAWLDPRIVSAGAGNEINILQICSTKSTKAKTPKAKAQSKTYNPFDDADVPTPVSVDELMTRRPGKGADNPFVDAETTDDAATPNEHEPKLDLPQLQTGSNTTYLLMCIAALRVEPCHNYSHPLLHFDFAARSCVRNTQTRVCFQLLCALWNLSLGLFCSGCSSTVMKVQSLSPLGFACCIASLAC